ncbi:MAG: sodium:proton exchanger [Acidimicrobiales bacterium]
MAPPSSPTLRQRRPQLTLAAAVAATLPGLAVRAGGLSAHGPVVRAGLYGMAIVGASLLLTWGAEVAQLDLSPGVAIAGLALVAVLPEYVVSATFAWRGGHEVSTYGTTCQSPAALAAGHASPCSLALANMLGANRILIGIGWSLVVLVAWRRTRTRRGKLLRGVVLGREHSVELAFLALASLWCLSLPFRHSVGLVDTCVLFAVFAGYGARLLQATPEEPELEGVAAWLGGLPTSRRRAATVALMVAAAAVIFACANAFADALVASGSVLGVDEFFLIQWVAPLASEAPELIIASIYAWRLRAAVGLGALVSSKVNQWTLLVGSLPIAFALGSWSLQGLPLGPVQRQELLLTAAQSVFGVAVLGNLEVSTAEAIALFVMFATEFVLGVVLPSGARGAVRIGFAVAYLAAAAVILSVKRRDTVALVEDGFRTPYHHLGESR